MPWQPGPGRLGALLVVVALPAVADVSVSFDVYRQKLAAGGVVHEPLWNEVRARPEAYRDRTLSYQAKIMGRIARPGEVQLIVYTLRDEPLTVQCLGGCEVGALGAWVGVLGHLPEDGSTGLLVARAVSRIAEPQRPQPAGPAGANGVAGFAELPEESADRALTGGLPAAPPETPLEPSPPEAPPRQTAPAEPVVRDWGAARLARLERFISGENPRLGAGEKRLIATEILRLAAAYGMRWEFLAAVIDAESNFNPYVTSSAGAQGLGQLMPGTAAGLGVTNPFDIRQNLYGAARYLKRFLDKYRDTDPSTQFKLTLASYNAGPGAVAKHGGVPPYAETINYIAKIARTYIALCAESAAAGE